MATVIRLSRGGAKKRPYYRIVVADSRMARDGRYIEKVGTYNPMLPKDSADRVRMDLDAIKGWLAKGALPSDRVSRFLEAEGVLEKKTRNNPNKGKPGQAAQDRIAEREEKAKAAEEAAAEAAAAPAEEAPAEEAPAEEAAAEAPAEEAAAEEAPAEEAAAEEEAPKE